MLKKAILPLFLLLGIQLCELKAISFANDRLEKLAGYVGLQSLDTLSPGVCNAYSYRQHPLTIRVNRWNEIEHIGLLLFPSRLREMKPMPIYDFLERYLLARNATPTNSEHGVKMGWDNVYFAIGNAKTALQIDTTTAFSESHVDLHVYKAAWTSGGKKLLEVSFEMDWQLLSGCNAIELEQQLFRNLRRFPVRPWPQTARDFPEEETDYTAGGNYFISPLIRNDIYYNRRSTKDEWLLTNTTQRPTRTLSNIMLTPEGNSSLKVMIKYDKYGLRTDSAMVDYRAWQEMCLDEGCRAYFGMKGKQGETYRGTVFMVNRLGGYLHLLSIDIPAKALDNPEANPATARLYCYIPLHNVSDRMLNINEFEPIK